MPLPVLREPSIEITASGHELNSVGTCSTATGVTHSSIAAVVRLSQGKNVLMLSCELASVLHLDSASLQLPG